jgi:hypothetical protein
MDRGTQNLSKLAEMLTADARRAWVRAFLKRANQGWDLHHLFAVVGHEPPGWLDEHWQYEEIAFVATAMPTADLAASLAATEDSALVSGPIAAHISDLRETAAWQRQPSFARHDRSPLPWPTVDYTLSANAGQGQLNPAGFLVGDGCPSFPEINSAWRAFVERDFSLSGAGAPPTDLMVVRCIDPTAWLGPIHVTATRLEVDVRGDDAPGSRLELYSATDRQAREVTEPGLVHFTLERGLPEQTWLWLKRGTSWLDYRAFHYPWATSEQLKGAGIHLEMPEDPTSALEALIAAGEGPHLEFKVKLPETKEEPHKTFKTVAAFANGDGGTLVFGIDPDEVTVIGIDGSDVARVRDRLGDLLRSRVIPTPEFSARVGQLRDKTVLVLDVQPGNGVLYGVISPGRRDRPDYYVRRGASTYHAQPEELRQVVARATPAQPTASRSFVR